MKQGTRGFVADWRANTAVWRYREFRTSGTHDHIGVSDISVSVVPTDRYLKNPAGYSAQNETTDVPVNMASHGDITQGNQIFISIRRGSEWPANVFDVRVRYEQTIADLKAAVCARLGLAPEKLQLFRHKKVRSKTTYRMALDC